MAHVARGSRGSFCVFALCLAAPAFAQTTPFPTDESQLPRHCLAVASGASAVGQQFSANAKAVPLAEPAAKLYDDVLVSGAFSRQDLARMKDEQEALANEARAFLARSGIPAGTRNPTNEALDEISSHLAQCRLWLTRRPPVLAALPKEGKAMVDHCVAAAVAAQSLSAFTGNRSGQNGVLATRVARNARDVLTEVHRSGISNPQSDRGRLKPPEGDLYLQGVDMMLGLKMANPGPIENVDARSLRLLDQRVRDCHKAMGLQMPLQ